MNTASHQTKVIFFGTSDFAVPVLQTLAASPSYRPALVITKPDQPTGRHQIITAPPVKTAAQQLDLEIWQPKSLDEDLKLKIKDAKMGIVASYGKIIPSPILNLFSHGLLNVHPSLLPRYRGPAPIQTAILNDELKTGITVIRLDEEMDHGLIIGQIKYPIPQNKYFKEIEKNLADLGAELLINLLPDYLNGKIIPQEQDHSQATFTKKFSLADGKIDWGQSVGKIYSQIRALNPEPGTWSVFYSKTVKIIKAVPTAQPVAHLAGQLSINQGKTLVATQDFYLRLELVQPAGKKPMSASQWINGLPR